MHINDRLLAYFADLAGVSSGHINDLMRDGMIAQGVTAGHINDMLYTWLGNLGFTGALTDRRAAFISSLSNPFYSNLVAAFPLGGPDPVIGTGTLGVTRASTASYQPTFSTVAYVGVNEVRYENGRLLSEEARTNLVDYSEDATQWGVINGLNLLSFTEVAPDGEADAVLAEFTSVTNAGVGPIITPAGATAHTASVWVKGPQGKKANVGIVDGIALTLVAGTTITFTGKWQRVSVTGTVVNAANLHYAFVGALDLIGGYTIEVGDQIELWGYQIEEGGDASSYIKTTGVAATRVVDNPYVAAANMPDYTADSTLAVDLEPRGVAGAYRGTFDTVGESFRQQVSEEATGDILTFIPGNVPAYGAGFTPGVKYRLTFSYNATGGTFSVYLNGSAVLTDAAIGVISGTMTQLDVLFAGGYALHGHGSNLTVYDFAMDATEVAQEYAHAAAA